MEASEKCLKALQGYMHLGGLDSGHKEKHS